MAHISRLVGNSEERARKREILAEAIRIVNEIKGRLNHPGKGGKDQKIELMHDLSSQFFKNDM
ncbi:hypothetical protein HV144_15895 [Citrobacter freundii]|nr:hypothetical protein [Citrobacter freundii]